MTVAAVTKDTEPGSHVFWLPVMPYKKAVKIHAYTMRPGDRKKGKLEYEDIGYRWCWIHRKCY